MLAGSTVKFPESTLDNSSVGFSHVIIRSFTVIFLQRAKETNIKGLKKVGRMGWKTEEFDIIANGILTKFEGDV